MRIIIVLLIGTGLFMLHPGLALIYAAIVIASAFYG